MKNEFRSQFRLPGSLYDRLKEAAEQNGRSLNAEIVVRLQGSFDTNEMASIQQLLDEQTELILAAFRRERS
jgi:CMP-2-keto-3-deoxyoctulosonic acid synthetase